jgi:branched-subunit amino acid transport protein AzlD
MVLIFIMLISFSFGIQAVTVRPLNIPEITTIVVTSAMVDLWSDKNIFKKYNR